MHLCFILMVYKDRSFSYIHSLLCAMKDNIKRYDCSRSFKSLLTKSLERTFRLTRSPSTFSNYILYYIIGLMHSTGFIVILIHRIIYMRIFRKCIEDTVAISPCIVFSLWYGLIYGGVSYICVNLAYSDAFYSRYFHRYVINKLIDSAAYLHVGIS